MKKRTVTIQYRNYAGVIFEKSFTGTEEEIQAEVDRLRSLPDVADAWVA